MRGKKRKKAAIKQRIAEKTGGVCAHCGKEISFEKVTIEHVVPRYRGGGDDERNLLPLCKKCNKQKGSRLVATSEYYPFLKSSFCISAGEYKKEWDEVSSGR